MKKKVILAITLFLGLTTYAQENRWSSVNESNEKKDLFAQRYKPTSYKLFRLDENAMKHDLQTAPSENNMRVANSTFVVTVPVSDGSIEHFKVVDAPVVEAGLLAKYPTLKSYAGVGIEDPSSYIRFSFTELGFNAIILSPNRNSIAITPLDNESKIYSVVSRDGMEIRKQFDCFTKVADNNGLRAANLNAKNADDATLRKFRLAYSAAGEYSQVWLNGTETSDAQRKSKVLAAQTADITSVNAIYERDFSVRMLLVSNNDAIIYLDPATDPYSTSSGWNSEVQTTVDSKIGNANYDIGHVVTFQAAPGNGNAGCIGCVCSAGRKGSGFTAYYDFRSPFYVIDFLTHEMGHQFGGNHTFTFSNEGTIAQCEPGSGTTIMGYAGITGANTDVAQHSDPYFHALTIQQVTDYVKSTAASCSQNSATGNNIPTANAGADFTIPKSTPFKLTGSATDADASDVLSYSWEQINVGSPSVTIPSATATSGPVFQFVVPTSSPSRTLPKLSSILDGTNGSKWEVLPSVARTLDFRLTVRDNHPNGGGNQSDDMKVNISTSGPFAVTAPNTAVSWAVGSTQTVTWSVNGTNGAPVNCANVKISLSTDGGNNFSTVLLSSTPNDGSETITVPNSPSTTCRIKVEAVGNIFFDISNTNFTIGGTPPTCTAPTGLSSSAITSSGATVNWTAVSGATSYDVDYKLATATAWTNAVTATTTTSRAITGLNAATLYDWRVRTNCSNGSSTYSQAQFTTSNANGGCATAFEPNETQATAATIVAGTTNSAAINTGTDVDYYKVVTTGTSNNTFDLVGPSGVDFDMYIYNSAGTQIGSSESATATENVSLTNQVAGTYFIKIIGYNGATSASCYTIKATVTPVTTGGCASALDNTTNGTTSGAATIPFNTNVTGLINPTGDIDHYKFVITTGGTITITLSTLPGDYDVKLLNSAGTQVAISENASTTSETINYTAAAGTYYVQVYGYNGANSTTICYTLKVATGTASRTNDYVLGTTKFNVYPSPVTTRLNFNLNNDVIGASIQVFDMAGRSVIKTNALTGNNSIDAASLKSGMYFINIISADGKIINKAKFVKE